MLTQNERGQARTAATLLRFLRRVLWRDASATTAAEARAGSARLIFRDPDCRAGAGRESGEYDLVHLRYWQI